MITKILTYLLLFMMVASITVVGLQQRELNNIKEDNENYKEAIKAYEEVIKVVPFEAMIKERKGNADNEINNTINNSNIITDGHYRL